MSEPAVRGGDAAVPRRAPRRRRVAMLAVLLAIAGIAVLVHWASRPRQVAALVMAQAGRALGLEITARGVSEYHLRGIPEIVLRDVEARMPGDRVALLRAERVLLSLPWSTLRSRGRDLVVHRVELDAPRLDVGALQRWQATRPDTAETRVPRLTDGLSIRRGRVDGEGWHVAAVDVDLPALAPDRPVRARLRGVVVAQSTRIPFDLRATLSRPAENAGLGVAGSATLLRPEWRLALDLVLRGRPRLGDELGLDTMALGADARYVAPATRLAFGLGVAGRLRWRDALVLRPLGLVLRQGREIPDLDGAGHLRWSSGLDVALQGSLRQWPAGWPGLPAPLARPAGPLPYRLGYSGPIDFSGRTTLALRSGATRLDADFRLPRVLDWLEADARGTPLPPLDGRLVTPRLEVPGMVLHGVRIEVDDGQP